MKNQPKFPIPTDNHNYKWVMDLPEGSIYRAQKSYLLVNGDPFPEYGDSKYHCNARFYYPDTGFASDSVDRAFPEHLKPILISWHKLNS